MFGSLVTDGRPGSRGVSVVAFVARGVVCAVTDSDDIPHQPAIGNLKLPYLLASYM